MLKLSGRKQLLLNTILGRLLQKVSSFLGEVFQLLHLYFGTLFMDADHLKKKLLTKQMFRCVMLFAVALTQQICTMLYFKVRRSLKCDVNIFSFSLTHKTGEIKTNEDIFYLDLQWIVVFFCFVFAFYFSRDPKSVVYFLFDGKNVKLYCQV